MIKYLQYILIKKCSTQCHVQGIRDELDKLHVKMSYTEIYIK